MKPNIDILEPLGEIAKISINALGAYGIGMLGGKVIDNVITEDTSYNKDLACVALVSGAALAAALMVLPISDKIVETAKEHIRRLKN